MRHELEELPRDGDEHVDSVRDGLDESCIVGDLLAERVVVILRVRVRVAYVVKELPRDADKYGNVERDVDGVHDGLDKSCVVGDLLAKRNVDVVRVCIRVAYVVEELPRDGVRDVVGFGQREL